ncbi:MAG TPA: cellulase family glycosylhydrolase [Candidatus Sumerlaeia bacterium]|nr:cellulase family glycosylhydrolase [Candidatus Sumerlaeia bacterium]
MRWKIFIPVFCLGLFGAIAAPPKPGVDVSAFGAQTVWPVNPDIVTILDRMKEGKIQWARFDLCWWGLCEREKGVYNFTHPNHPGYEGWNTDRAINLLHERGIEPFPILCYGNELYDNNQGPFSDEGRTAFGNFCYAAAARYKTSVYYWEIWNEPNLLQFWGRAPSAIDYTLLVKVAAARIREANPDAVIAGGVTSGIDKTYLEICFQNGLLDAVDVVTIHPYRFTKPESVNTEYAALRSIMAKYTSRSVPLWSGEWGYNTCSHQMSVKSQAKALSRMMVNNLSQDIGLSIWFSTHPFVEDQRCPADPQWGLLDYQYNPRPSMAAMKTLNERMSPPIKPVSDPFTISMDPQVNGWRVAVFEKKKDLWYVAAIWLENWPVYDSYTGKLVTLGMTLPQNASVRAYDGLTGDELNFQINSSGAQTNLTDFRVQDYPIFLEIKTSQSPANGIILR